MNLSDEPCQHTLKTVCLFESLPVLTSTHPPVTGLGVSPFFPGLLRPTPAFEVLPSGVLWKYLCFPLTVISICHVCSETPPPQRQVSSQPSHLFCHMNNKRSQKTSGSFPQISPCVFKPDSSSFLPTVFWSFWFVRYRIN